MWSEPATRAVRARSGSKVASYWDDLSASVAAETITPEVADVPPPAPVELAEPHAEGRPSFAELEREAFVKGYAEGERSGAEAAARRGEATLRRLAQTVEDLAGLRAELIQKTERQVVELALAMCARILHRQVSLDRELLIAMARVALERLGENTAATIRLNPGDHAFIGARAQAGDGSIVRIVADPLVSPGGCLVQSDFGLIDVGIAAQLGEMAAAIGVTNTGVSGIGAERGAA